MPLGNFATILPFLSPSSSPSAPIPRLRSPAPPPPPPLKKEKEKKKPALRICFPLKIQRGESSWWEYEEFRIEFRDRLMWRQAFGLDDHDHASSSSNPSSRYFSDFEGGCGEDEGGRLKFLAGANGTFYDDVDSDADDEEDRGMKSRWSFSSASSSTSSVDTNRTDALSSEGVSATSSNRLMYLIPRLLFLTRADDGSTQERSSSTIKVGSEQKKQQLGPAPLNLESTRQHVLEGVGESRAVPARPPPPSPLFGTPFSSAAAPALTSEAAKIQHHRNVTLQKLEGSYVYSRKERYLSTFRSIFRTPKSPAPETTTPTLPNIPAVAPLRLNSPLQDAGRCSISSREWANLRDDIVSGLSADAEALFPFLTDDQKAIFMRVEQKEGKFKVEHGDGVTVGGGGVKEALERLERRGWEDVLFVEFEDTPRAMRWWYTTREPQVFEWGASMI
ncbi:hypothetical protein TgHK011_003753 [Trichoderma gracile]|nr:hypothetical protein TgHK011_003753 [Trichoderma gracile]